MDREQEVRRILSAIDSITRGHIEDMHQAMESLLCMLALSNRLREIVQKLPCPGKPSRPRAQLEKFRVIQGGKQ